MRLHFGGTLTKQDYVDIITLATSPLKNARRGEMARWIPSIFLLIVAVVVGIGTLWYGFTRGDSIILLTAIGPFLMVVLILSSLRRGRRLAPAAQAEMMWRNEANRNFRLEGTVTDEGIAMKTEAGESLIKWEGFLGYGEYKDIVVLVQQAKTFLSLPKRFFEKQEDWARFRIIVGEKLTEMYRVDESTDGRLPTRA